MTGVLRAVLAATALTLVTACGSTVQLAGDGTALAGTDAGTDPTTAGGSLGLPDTAIDGAGLDVPGAGTAIGPADGLPATAGTTVGGGTGGAMAPSAGAGPSAAGGAGAGAASAPGVTERTIALGLPYSVNSQAAAAAFGASGGGAGGGNDRAQWEIAVRDLNARGGILGRKVVPVYHVNDSTDSTPTDQKEQAACAHWTEDNQVFAVLAPEGSPSETLLRCLHKAGAAQVHQGLTRADRSTFERYPYYIEAGTLRMDRVAAAWPGALRSQGYFGGWNTRTGAPGSVPVKVGVVSFDDATTVTSVEQHLAPGLEAAGFPMADWVQIQYPRGAADNGSAISAIQGAVLRFASAGITHVLPFDAQGAGIGIFFAQGADSQRYYPRYGLNSGVGGQTGLDTGLWPVSQLRGSMGFGWVPLLDLAYPDNPDDGPYSNDARRRCLELMVKNGQAMNSSIVKRQAIAKCDELQLVKSALEAGGPTISRDSLIAGLQRLGSRFESGLTFSTRYDRGHHDGAAAVRNFAFQPACTCFRYTGPSTPIG